MPVAGHVVFDMDGVLVDSEPVHERANAEYLAGLGVTLDQELADDMMGRRVRELTDALAERLGLEPERVFSDREAIFWRLLDRGLQPMPGLHAAVDRLAAAGLPLAVASSGTRAYVAHVLDLLGVRAAFATVVSGEDVHNGKPDPEIYLLAAARLHADPADCVAVEDTTHGIAAAHGAGMRAVAVTHPMNATLDLSAADAVVADLTAAAAWILA
ncbi:MAG TPA: HAD family phosphatase [Actinomycetota bacterium]|jgi:HAD superfamily hydrolase (TIGR01509 family)